MPCVASAYGTPFVSYELRGLYGMGCEMLILEIYVCLASLVHSANIINKGCLMSGDWSTGHTGGMDQSQEGFQNWNFENRSTSQNNLSGESMK